MFTNHDEFSRIADWEGGVGRKMYRHSVTVSESIDKASVFARIEKVADKQKEGGILDRSIRKYLSNNYLHNIDWKSTNLRSANGLISLGKIGKGHVIVEINQKGNIEVVVFCDNKTKWAMGLTALLALFPPFWALWPIVIIVHFGAKYRCKAEARNLAKVLESSEST